MKTKFRFILVLLCLIYCQLSSLLHASEVIDVDLLTRLQNAKPLEKFRVMIFMKDQAGIQILDRILTATEATLQERHQVIVETLQDLATASQPDILIQIQDFEAVGKVAFYRNFWIINALNMEATSDIIYILAERDDVQRISIDWPIRLDAPVEEKHAIESINSAEIGLKVINAHKLWEKGFTGQGVIVMNIDDGVDGTHPALTSRWRGNEPGVPGSAAWFDPVYGTTFPTNFNNDHGSHTMGTMTGLDEINNDTIGVAFEAKWIAAATNFFWSNNVAAFQWAADPDGNPATVNDVPAVINNSYASNISNQCDTTNVFYLPIRNVEALGTAVVFSAGNDGPAPQSITTPKNGIFTPVNIWATGALNGNNPGYPIASFSSRGPSICDGVTIKPEASAPGVSVRSSIPGGYGLKSGTSMAAPHVAGAIALLRSIYPNKTGTELKYALLNTAVDLGNPGEDNTYGMGLIDVYAAFFSIGDTLDPNPPTSVETYSDYTTPTSMFLTWTDPVTLVNGTPISHIDFNVELERNGSFIASVGGGIEQYIDSSLSDGQLYEYAVFTSLIANDSTSSKTKTSWYAGGSPIPAPPSNLYCTADTIQAVITWNDPTNQEDGTPLDDLDSIYIYRDDSLIARVAAGVETYNDSPLAGFQYFYYVKAKDNETPPNLSASSNIISCFIGTSPDFLVWVGSSTIGTSSASGDSIFEALAANGESVFLTNDLFEFGSDLNKFKGIFIILGIFPYNHIIGDLDPEGPALEAYLQNGGRLFLEGGDCFYWDPDHGGYNIRPWFSLAPGEDGTNDLFGVIGLNYFSNFTFDYEGLNLWMDQLEPINSTPIWQNDITGAICGVWNVGFGTGLAIGVVPSFGGLVDSSNKNINPILTQKSNFQSVNKRLVSRQLREPVKFVKKYAHRPSLKKNRKQKNQIVKFSDNGVNIKANTKNDLMAAYLTLLESNPPHALDVNLNTSNLVPGTDTLWVSSNIANPDTHQISVQTFIESFDQSLVDSIPMFDDGNHHDSTASDGLYGGFWPVPPYEQSYKVKIHTYSIDLGTNHFFNDVFTTIGPIILDKYRITSSDTIPHHGDRLRFEFTLKNEGSITTAENITSQIVSLDTFSTIILLRTPQYGDIVPGATAVGNQAQTILFNPNSPDSINVSFRLDIWSNDLLFWDDTFSVFVHRVTGIDTKDKNLPKEFALKQNYPNPFNPITTIEFSIPKAENVSLKIYNLLGQEVAKLVSDKLTPGNYEYTWDASQLASGVYIYKLEAGEFSDTCKLILMK